MSNEKEEIKKRIVNEKKKKSIKETEMKEKIRSKEYVGIPGIGKISK